jgi:hypothetical protein
MSKTYLTARDEIRAAIKSEGLSCAEFADLALEDLDTDDGVDVAALTETWSALQPQ